MLVWLNGRLVPAARARVSALDRGLLHGDGVYDTWRTYDGEPFAVAAHVARLAAAARRLGLASPGPATAWTVRSRLLVRKAGLADAALRLTITRGAAGEALLPERACPPTMLLLARPLPKDLDRRRARGIAAALLPFPRDASGPWGGLKLVGHPSAVAGRAAAAKAGADEGLYVTASGEVTEGTTANVWLVEHGTLVTPPLDAGVLPGVTRALVLRLARAAGVRVREEPLPVRRVRAACELFVSASTIEVMPVVRLDRRRVGDGTPGEVTRLLQTRYRAYVMRSLALQVRGKPVRRVRTAWRGEVLR